MSWQENCHNAENSQKCCGSVSTSQQLRGRTCMAVKCPKHDLMQLLDLGMHYLPSLQSLTQDNAQNVQVAQPKTQPQNGPATKVQITGSHMLGTSGVRAASMLQQTTTSFITDVKLLDISVQKCRASTSCVTMMLDSICCSLQTWNVWSLHCGLSFSCSKWDSYKLKQVVTSPVMKQQASLHFACILALNVV